METTNLDAESRQYKMNPNKGMGMQEIALIFDNLNDLLQQILNYEISNHGWGSPEFWLNNLWDAGAELGSAALFGWITKGFSKGIAKLMSPKTVGFTGRLTEDAEKLLESFDNHNETYRRNIDHMSKEPQNYEKWMYRNQYGAQAETKSSLDFLKNHE